MAGIEIVDGGFVGLEVVAFQHTCVHGAVYAAEVVMREVSHPLAHGVAREVDAVMC